MYLHVSRSPQVQCKCYQHVPSQDNLTVSLNHSNKTLQVRMLFKDYSSLAACTCVHKAGNTVGTGMYITSAKANKHEKSSFPHGYSGLVYSKTL